MPICYTIRRELKAIRATTEQYLENAAGKLHPELVFVDSAPQWPR